MDDGPDVLIRNGDIWAWSVTSGPLTRLSSHSGSGSIEDIIGPEAAVAWDRDGMSDLVSDATRIMVYHNIGTFIHSMFPNNRWLGSDPDPVAWCLYIDTSFASAMYLVDEMRWVIAQRTSWGKL